MTTQVVCAIQDASKFDTISYPPILESSFQISKGYETFGSRTEILKDIMKALRDVNASRIGVYGMGGIGKTMLAKEIARKVEKEEFFSKVVMTIISQTPNIKDIQKDIAEKLNLSFGQTESVDMRADLLRKRLKQEDKILLILDDIWGELDLLAIGIHFEEYQQGCKMLLTSRSLDVLCNFMGVENSFSIQALATSEATNLFKNFVGDILENADFNSLAHQIIAECAGLPLAITTVAHALKYKNNLSIWKDALKRLKSSNPIESKRMYEKVYSSIKLSYNFLGSDEEVKSLLLLCSLHQEDENIMLEDLMRYSVGWNLLQDFNTLEEARDRVVSLVDKLKSHCLLLDGDYYGSPSVKMHDVIRDVCILIASEDKHMYSIANVVKLEEFLSKKKHREVKAISLLEYADFGKLPERLECPKLELLLMSDYSLTSIPDYFFEQTSELQSLVLNDTMLTSLPSSFRSLQHLETLCLRGSELEDVTCVGEIKNLKVLDLSHSAIKRLPRKIGELHRLRLLDLQNCYRLEVIEPNVISNLTRLEELYMANQFHGWEVEEDGIDERRNVSLAELKNLQQLMVLHLSVPDAKAFPEKYLFSEKLERYRISVGVLFPSFRDGISRALHLSLNQRSQLHALGLELLMKRSEHLWLSGFRGITNFVDDLDREGFPRLKHLEFYDNDGVQSITMHQIHSSSVFRSLETLNLGFLINLERICQGKFTADSFNNLREVNVRNCGRLKNLFPLSIVKRLRVIEVDECEMIEEIVTHERESDDHSMSNEAADEVEFSELRRLRLTNLPNFVQFCSCEVEETGGSSSTDSDPKPLFRKKVSFPNLDYLDLNGVNVEKLWPEELLANSYIQNLTSLKIISCNSLKYLFSFSVTERLENLKRVEARDCMAMEDFLVTNREEGTRLEITVHVFPKLEELKLDRLPALKRLCPADSCFEFPSLFQLHMKSCPKLTTIVMPIQVSIDADVNMPLFNGKVICPSLKQLTCFYTPEAVYEIFDMTQSSIMPAFRNLEVLRVSYKSHHKPIALSYFKFFQKYPNIETLQLRGFFVDGILCQQQPDGGPREQDGTYKHVSTRLKQLQLIDAPMLRHLFGDPENAQPSNTIAFQTLEVLNVKRCSRLQSFALSFMSFQNLKSLRISGCHGLTYLFASSTAATLVQLKEMSIFNCKRMTEIINGDYYTEGPTRESQYNEFVFRRLWHLQISLLPSLKSFYSGNKVISFPSMKFLLIFRCPEMRSFSHGTVSTSEDFWASDVNSTVRRIWEKSSNLELEHLFAPETCVPLCKRTLP